MNLLKILGILLIVGTGIELLRITSEYSSGQMKSWPIGAGIGACIQIALGIILIRKGNNRQQDTL
jgi:hypothetical protein